MREIACKHIQTWPKCCLQLCLDCCPCRFLRQPLQCNPEAVLVQTGLEAPSVTAFLHENILDFIADDGMQSTADVMGYISISGVHSCTLTKDPYAQLLLVVC